MATWSDHFWAGCAVLGVAVLVVVLFLGALWVADWIRWRPATKGILRPKRRSLAQMLFKWVSE